MIINNSKKALAAKIRNSGFAWPDSGKWATQNKGGEVFVSGGIFVPVRRVGEVNWEFGEPYRSAGILSLGSNWFQCILSRDEYFHLYPAQDADGWIEWKGGECPVEMGVLVDVRWRDGAERIGVKALNLGGAGAQFWIADNKSNDIVAYRLHKSATEVVARPERIIIEPKPTIEQLASDYKAKLAIAQKAQEEADSHRCGAEAALEKLYQAGLAIGLDIAIADDTQEDENRSGLVITDWRDLQVGDIIECLPGYWGRGFEGRDGRVVDTEVYDYEGVLQVCVEIDGEKDWGDKFKFIRRP